MNKVCGTCAYFKVPQTWRGLRWNRTDTQVGICEHPTPVIPKVIDWTRCKEVGEAWTCCPTWTEDVRQG